MTGGTRASSSRHVSGYANVDMDSLPIPDLIEFLRSSFLQSDFCAVGSAIVARFLDTEERLRQALEAADASSAKHESKWTASLERYRKLVNLRSEASEELERCKAMVADVQREAERVGEEVEVGRRREELLSERIVGLEGEVREKERVCQMFVELKAEKLVLEEEKRKVEEEAVEWKRKFVEKERACVMFMELKAEKVVLEEEKRKAEGEAMDWKRKFAELEAKVLRMVGKNPWLRDVFEGKKSEAGILGSDPTKQSKNAKSLDLKNEKVMSESIAVNANESETKLNSGTVIEIIDSDESEGDMGAGGLDDLRERGAINVDESDLDDVNVSVVETDGVVIQGKNIGIQTPKRRHAPRLAFSDSDEQENEDDMLIGRQKRPRKDSGRAGENICPPSEDNAIKLSTPGKRRLVTLRQCGQIKSREKKKSNKHSNSKKIRKNLEYPTTGIAEVDDRGGREDVEDDSLESEADSLSGFIVDEFDDMEDESSNGEHLKDTESNSTSPDPFSEKGRFDDGTGFGEVLSALRREKKPSKWEYEADMLTSLSNDTDLCMKAVCVLFRQQTLEEQSAKASIAVNNRGFSKLDAPRASKIAEFLTGGFLYGSLFKSVQDLEKFDQGAVEYCCELALRYSKQLYAIYMNREDPSWNSSC